MPMTLTKTQCGSIVRKHLAGKNLLEVTSGKGDDFADAIGEALFDVATALYGDVKTFANTHIHAYVPPTATATGPAITPMV